MILWTKLYSFSGASFFSRAFLVELFLRSSSCIPLNRNHHNQQLHEPIMISSTKHMLYLKKIVISLDNKLIGHVAAEKNSIMIVIDDSGINLLYQVVK
jgi:hypothetical protein